MRRSRKPIVIASRRSPLARVQAELAGRALQKLHPDLTVEFRWIESEGDVDQTGRLADRGGKGLFTRAIERALLSGDADLAVHSMKDLPAKETPGLRIAAVPKRADVRDCLIARDGVADIADLPAHAVVGTSSPRRAAQLLQLRHDLQITLMRGNVDSRLAKVHSDDGHRRVDATLLAMAGLLRLKHKQHASAPIAVEQMLPAGGQGALALQCRADDHVTVTRCLPLNDPMTATAVHAERQVLAGLEAGCHSPIAVYVCPVDGSGGPRRRQPDVHYRLRVRVLSGDGEQCLTIDRATPGRDLRHVVERCIADLRDQGAAALLHPAPTPEAPAIP